MRSSALSDRIGQLQSKDKVDDSLPGIPRAPVSAYLNAFQTELEKFKEQIPRHLRGHKLLMNHYNTAKLKLWEPPAVDVKILDSLSDTFTSFSLDGPSALDVFYRAHGALKSWFEFWLSIDITDYFYLPMPVCAQLLVAVTLLSRWAKLAGADPYNASSNTLSTLHTKPTAEGLMDPSSYELSANAVAEPKFPDAEPAVASAIAKIKAHIRSQPGLQLDVVGILRALVSRFEQARSEVSEVQGGAWENNIWDLAAKKISITKLKLERWAEIVSAVGAEGLLARKYLPGDGPIQDGVESSSEAAAVASPMEGVEKSQSIEFMQQPAGPDGWQYNNNNFAHDLFDGLGLDQNFFYDDGGDYGTAILNNLNNFNGFTYQGPAI